MTRFRISAVSFAVCLSLALAAGLAWLSERDHSAELESVRAAALRNRGAAGDTAADKLSASRVRDFKRGSEVVGVEAEARVRGALEAVVDLSFHGMTVPQALEFLHGLTKIEFRLTAAAVRAGAEKLTLNGRYAGMKLSAVLAVALGQHGLAYRLKDGTVWIGTRSEGPLDPEMAAVEQAAEDEEIRAIREKLDTTKIDLDFVDSTLWDMVDFVQEFAKINIVIASDVRKDGTPEKKTTLQVHDLRLDRAVSRILEPYALTWSFENRVLLIHRPDPAAALVVLEIHDVRDLVPPPNRTVGRGPVEFPEEDPSLANHGPRYGERELIEQIRHGICRESWSDRAGEVSIALEDTGLLQVVHTSEVQDQIRTYLERMRADGRR